ncbi:MAG: ogr/Delta-like zinc finger family protein [Collimonas sp.]|uniref:ogr/Delta-like zinc finger family protein n=1 Tax=Collimonas sp. TaxID=1963772 RepID=UPI003267F395
MRVISIRCPRCHHHVITAKNCTMSDMMKEITYTCQNPVCGFIFVASLKQATEWLASVRLHKQSRQISGRSRALYPADRKPS